MSSQLISSSLREINIINNQLDIFINTLKTHYPRPQHFISFSELSTRIKTLTTNGLIATLASHPSPDLYFRFLAAYITIDLKLAIITNELEKIPSPSTDA